MDPRSEVVLRQQEFLSGSVLLVNAPCDELNTQLIDAVEPHFWTWNFNELQYFQNQQSDVHFGTDLPDVAFDQAIVFVPKSKELLNYVLHQLVSRLAVGALIFLVVKRKAV